MSFGGGGRAGGEYIFYAVVSSLSYPYRHSNGPKTVLLLKA